MGEERTDVRLRSGFVDPEQRARLEQLRRSLSMDRSGTGSLDRDQALQLIAELQATEARLRELREGLHRLLEG